MFGLGINKLGSSRSQASATPETLFYAGEEGTFLDFTASQVYADTAGTDPAEVGEGIALTLDKSQGGVARRNLLERTEEFDNAYWTKIRGGTGTTPVVTANAGLAPDGSMTADRIEAGIASGSTTIADFSLVRRVIAGPGETIGTVATNHKWSVHLKSNTGLNQQVTLGYGGGAVPMDAVFTVTNDWQRFDIFPRMGGGGLECDIGVRGLAGAGAPNESIDILAWGGQAETGSTSTTYQKITTGINGEWTPGTHSTQATSTARPIFARVPVGGRRNLLLSTEDMVSPWLTSGEVSLEGGIDDPLGGLTAFRITAVSGLYRLSQTLVQGLVGNSQNSISLWLRHVEGSTTYRFFAGNASRVIAEISSEWAEYHLPFTADSGGPHTPFQLFRMIAAGQVMEFWHPQLETGSTATPYQKVVTANDITEAGVSSIAYANYDGVDDILPITLPAITGGTVALVGLNGIWIEDDWDYAGGTLNIGPTTIEGLPAGILDVVGDLCAVIINDRAWTAAERAGVVAWGKARGAPGVFSLGEETVINGIFDTDTDWTKDTGWTISGGVANYSGNLNANRLLQSATRTNGEKYLVSVNFTMANTPSSPARVSVNIGGFGQNVLFLSQSGLVSGNSYTIYGIGAPTAASSPINMVQSNANYQMDYSMDNFSVRKLELIP